MKYKKIKLINNKIFLAEYKKTFYAVKTCGLAINPLKISKIHIIIGNHKHINQLIDQTDTQIIYKYYKNTLLDFIELNKGMDLNLVHYFFRQLVDGLHHMHKKNICHRDLKPDNCFVDENFCLVISDFESATLIFSACKCTNQCKCIKQKRALKSLAGSYEYMSPEQYLCNYEGDKADIWALGIILLFMLTGTLSWGVPDKNDENFEVFQNLKYLNYSPFNRIDYPTLTFLKRLLCINPKERITIEEIKESDFYKREISFPDLIVSNKPIPFSQPTSKTLGMDFKNTIISSQPIDKSVRRTYIPVEKSFRIKEAKEAYNLLEINEREFLLTDLLKIKLNSLKDFWCVTFYKLKKDEEAERMVGCICAFLKDC